MKLPEFLIDPNVRFVGDAYPSAYQCSDSNGYYILDSKTHDELGRGKKPAKAWKDAAQKIIKSRLKGKEVGVQTYTRPKSPRKVKRKNV